MMILVGEGTQEHSAGGSSPGQDTGKKSTVTTTQTQSESTASPGSQHSAPSPSQWRSPPAHHHEPTLHMRQVG